MLARAHIHSNTVCVCGAWGTPTILAIFFFLNFGTLSRYEQKIHNLKHVFLSANFFFQSQLGCCDVIQNIIRQTSVFKTVVFVVFSL